MALRIQLIGIATAETLYTIWPVKRRPGLRPSGEKLALCIFVIYYCESIEGDGYLKTKFVVPIISFVIIISALISYRLFHVNMWNNGFAAPYKINLNIQGKQNQIYIDDKHSQSLVKEINKLIIFDMPNTLGLDSPADKNDVKGIEEFAVEYVYDKPQNISVNNPDIEQVQFIEMIFPLDIKWENQVYIKTKDDLFYFIGNRPDLGALVRSAVY